MENRLPALLLLLLSVFAAGNSYASTLTITKTDDTNDGSCDAADCSLREAVLAASPDDTIGFSALFNSPQTVILAAGQITIDKSLTITGTGQNLVTISGNNASRIFLIMGAGVAVNVSGITFRDGDGSDFGGGAIYVFGSTLTATNVTFTNNTSGTRDGGAIFGINDSTFNLSHVLATGNSSPQGRTISGAHVDQYTGLCIETEYRRRNRFYNLSISRCLISDHNFGGVSSGHLTIIDSTVMNNSTLGGISSGDSLSTITIERCMITGNSRIRGGGGVISAGTMIIKDSQITNNRAVGLGGGIYNEGTFYLINSTVSDNIAEGDISGINGGGGISNELGRLFLINSTISGNSTSGKGGGIYDKVGATQNLGRVYLVNSTIANNTAAGEGGGIRIDPEGEGDFSNSIVAGNNSAGTSQEDVSGVITSNGINLIGNTVGSSGWIEGDLLNVNAMLGPLGNNGGCDLYSCSSAGQSRHQRG